MFERAESQPGSTKVFRDFAGRILKNWRRLFTVQTSRHGVKFITLIVAVVVLVLSDQAANGGFSRGHHGWVSAHALAIASHVHAENGFLGYASKSIQDDGSIAYHYFDRYPLWMSGLLKIVIDSRETFSEQIIAGRVVMNLVYVGTFVASVLLLFQILGDRVAAVSASLLTMSSYYIVQYRDMIHYDQPAIMGLVILIYCILRIEQEGRIGIRFICLALVFSLGRSYALLPTLMAWCSFDLWRTWRSSGDVFVTIAIWRKAPPFRVVILAAMLSFVYLGYNVAMEARIRQVSLAETSILDSASRRLGFDSGFEIKREVPFTWSDHFVIQVQRLATSVIPYPPFGSIEMKKAVPYYVGRLGLIFNSLMLAFGAVVIWIFARRLSRGARLSFILLACSGMLWLVPMRNLAIPHEYTTLYHWGALLAFNGAVVSFLVAYDSLRYFVVAAASAVFIGSLHSSNVTKGLNAEVLSSVSDDFQRIVRIVPGDEPVYVAPPYDLTVDAAPDVVPGVPYAVAYYLQNRFIATHDGYRYVISRDRAYGVGDPCVRLLTAGNSRVFLFERLHCQGD